MAQSMQDGLKIQRVAVMVVSKNKNAHFGPFVAIAYLDTRAHVRACGETDLSKRQDFLGETTLA